MKKYLLVAMLLGFSCLSIGNVVAAETNNAGTQSEKKKKKAELRKKGAEEFKKVWTSLSPEQKKIIVSYLKSTLRSVTNKVLNSLDSDRKAKKKRKKKKNTTSESR